jgi:hypothetical protein
MAMNFDERINSLRRAGPTNYAELAADAGNHSRDAFWEEFAKAPDPEQRDLYDDWASSAWAIAWHELRDGGAPEDKRDACRRAWLAAFWSTAEAETD